MLGTSTQRMTTRRAARSDAERKAETERKKREAKLFQIRKIIGPNDLAVNRKLGKVKVEKPEEEVKPDPELGEEPEVKVRTVTEEIDLDVEEGTSEPILVPPTHDDQTGSLAGLETNEDKVEEGTDSGGETMAELHREIESLRQQLNAALSRGEQPESRMAKLIAENEAQRQEILSLKEVIADLFVENRRLRKDTPEAASSKSTEDGESVGLQVDVEMQTGDNDKILDNVDNQESESGKPGSARNSDLGQENCSAEEHLEDQRLEIEEPLQQLNEASLERQSGTNSSEDNGEMNMAQEFTGNLVTISSGGVSVNETRQRSIKLGIRNQRRILRPRPNSRSLRKHHKQLHDDDDKSKSSQHTRRQIAKTGETKRHNITKVNKKSTKVQHASSPNETLAFKQRYAPIFKPLNCPRPQCAYRCARQSSLKTHINLHDDPFAFQCKLCKKVYRTGSNLQCHINTMHNPNTPRNQKPKPFKCDQCPAKFCTIQGLKTHLKLHQNPSAFGCDICQINYSTEFNLKYHRMRHHSDK